MGALTSFALSILTPIVKALIPLIVDELKKHREAEVIGGGDSVRDAVNADVDRRTGG